MYDLNWTEFEYSVLYLKAGREIPLRVVLGKISQDEMIAYEQAAMKPFTVDRDGGTTTDLLAKDGTESEMFDKYFIRMNGMETNGTPRDAILAKVPQQVKIAVIRRGVGGVQPKTERQEVKSLDELMNNKVLIVEHVNGELHEMEHEMAEPSAEDAIAYHRATAGKLRTLPGRKQRELMVVQRFKIYPELYDKLVQNLKGYKFGNSDDSLPLGEADRDDWKKLIPYTHKKIVVQQLFGHAELDEEGE